MCLYDCTDKCSLYINVCVNDKFICAKTHTNLKQSASSISALHIVLYFCLRLCGWWHYNPAAHFQLTHSSEENVWKKWRTRHCQVQGDASNLLLFFFFFQKARKEKQKTVMSESFLRDCRWCWFFKKKKRLNSFSSSRWPVWQVGFKSHLTTHSSYFFSSVKHALLSSV